MYMPGHPIYIEFQQPAPVPYLIGDESYQKA